jgi:rhamnose transport system permease protein
VSAATGQVERPPLVGRLSSGRLIDLAYRLRAFGILAALAVLIVVTSAIQPRFLSGNEVNIVLGNTSILALLSLGEAMVVITRNVDLSSGRCSVSPPTPPGTCSVTCTASSTTTRS